MKFLKLFFSLFLLLPTAVFALVFPMPNAGNSIVGAIQTVTMDPSDTFFDMSRKYNIGYEALVAANPHVDPFENRKKPVQFIIPSRFILPPVEWKGIVINVAEMKLYYFTPDSQFVYIFPIGVGRQGWATPTGQTAIIQKIKNPYWHIPDSIREHAASQGFYYPEKVPPGPQDPLGDFALRLGIPGYLIHGTNAPNSIGARSSSGCIRMYPESIEQLFALVSLKTPVHIIDAPYKVGIENGKLYLEAHQPMENNQIQQISDVTPMLQALLSDGENLKAEINWREASEVAKNHYGIPEPIGKAQTLNTLSPIPATSPGSSGPTPATENPPEPPLELPVKSDGLPDDQPKAHDNLPDSALSSPQPGAPVENGIGAPR